MRKSKLKSERLDRPRQEPRKEKTRKHEIGLSHVQDAPKKKATKLRKNRKRKVDRYDPRSPLEDAPDMVATGRRVKVAEVTSSNSWQFYNPAEAISEAIRDSLDPDKVIQQAARECEVTGDTETGPGFKIPVKYVLEEREKAKCFRLPSGWDMWVPKAWIIEEGRYHIRVPKRVRFKLEALRLPPKPEARRRGLTKEEVKRRLRGRFLTGETNDDG